MVFYYASLDLPKMIINQPIQGKGFASPDATAAFLRLHFTLPDSSWADAKLELFDGFALERTSYLFALTLTFLALIIISGLIKLRINTMKGWMGERMLRRLRYYLFDHILRFPLPTFRRVKSAEMATMIKDEVDPLGGFVGEAIITPLYLGGQALTALGLHPVPACLPGHGGIWHGDCAGHHHSPDAAAPARVVASSARSPRAISQAGWRNVWTAWSRYMRTTRSTMSGPNSPPAWVACS